MNKSGRRLARRGLRKGEDPNRLRQVLSRSDQDNLN